MKSITLSYADLKAILELHINTHELRVPYRILDIDACDYDGVGEMQVHVHIAPAKEALSADQLIAAGYTQAEIDDIVHCDDGREPPAGFFEPLGFRSNVNGASKNGGGATPDKVTTEVAPEPPAATRKRRSPCNEDQRQHIIRLAATGVQRQSIAAAVGVSVSTVYDVISQARADGQHRTPRPDGNVPHPHDLGQPDPALDWLFQARPSHRPLNHRSRRT